MSMIGDYIYKDDKCVGKGTFGTVYTAYKNNHPETIYALKEIDLKSLNKEDKRHCYDEVKWMRDIQHPNIVQYHDSFEHKNRFLIIIMEYCQNGSLKNYIQKSQPIPERKCLEMVKQICSALKFLHEQRKIHRDIKTDNIFITSNNTLKLGDLALVRLMENPTKLTTYCGSPLYMSPEMSDGKSYSYQTDVWSLGCCIYEIAMKTSPFSARTEDELRKKISTETIRKDKFPYSEAVQTLMTRMLHKDPDQRPNIFEVDNIVNTLLHKPVLQADGEGSDNEDFVLPAQMRNLTVASATFPGPNLDMCTGDPVISRCTRKKKLLGGFPRRRKSERSYSSSDDWGYSSADAKDACGAGSETKIVHIAVEVTPEESHMMKLAAELETTLKGYLSHSEWQKTSALLIEASSEEPANREKFMKNVGSLLKRETFDKVQIFLESYWSFKVPLLKRTYKIAQFGT